MIPSITQDQALTALGNLLTAVLPAGVTVVTGQVNRVPTLLGDFVEMWPLGRSRLSTNVETPLDCKFTAAIAAAVMTVSAVASGTITPGNQVFGIGVADGTVIQSQTSGTTGGAGVYAISPPQNVASETMSAGALQSEQSTELMFQIDVHGPKSADNMQVISTVFRSDYAVAQMESSGVTPLFADDPRQVPFMTAASQFEERWTIDVHLQIKPTISTPQQFADAVTLTTTVVEVAYPQ